MCFSLAALNILQAGHVFKLIDLDASINFKESGAFSGLKYSSACLPPEMFWKDGNGMIKVRSVQDWSPQAGYDLVVATPALDMWSLGCVLFLLTTGIKAHSCENVTEVKKRH